MKFAHQELLLLWSKTPGAGLVCDSTGIPASYTSSITECQYIGVGGGSPVSDSLSQSIVAGAISGERLSILHPGDSGGWRHSRHTCQCTTLLLVGQVCDDGRVCGRRESMTSSPYIQCTLL